MPDIEKCPISQNTDRPSSDGNTLKPNAEHVLCGDAPSSISLADDKASQHECPEGGIRAYLTVIGAFLALFCTFGVMNSFGTYHAWYSGNQLKHLSPSTISWIGSLQLWVFFFSGGPIGQLFDTFGPSWLLIAGSAVYVFSIMMTSLSSQFYQYILAQGILFGLGVGLLFYPSLASVSTYFSKYRATALGVAAAGSSIGGVVFPIMLQHLFTTVGFGWGVRISGLVCAACCITATLTVTTFSTPKKTDLCVGIKTFTDTRYILLTLGSSLVALGLFIPFFYIAEYAVAISIPINETFYVLAVMNAGSVFGRVAPAYLSDIFGCFNLLAPSAFFSGLSCLVFWMFTRSLASLMVFAALYGFFSGAFISVITPCVVQISDRRQIGVRIGMIYSIISFPSLVGGPAAGALLAHGRGTYDDMIIFSGSTLVAGSFFILLARLSINSQIFARV